MTAARFVWSQHRPLWQVGLAAAMVAAAASVAVYLIARAAGVPMALTEVFETRFARMPVANMAFAALLEGGLAGTTLAAACRRWARRPRVSFLISAAIGLIASFALPITSDGSTATKVVLSISHVVVAAIVVPAWRWRFLSRQPGGASRAGNPPVATGLRAGWSVRVVVSRGVR
jgi:hypothetical protein